MKLSARIIVLILVLFLGSQNVLPAQPQSQPFTYLALGDSYTIGENVSSQNRWPVLLADTLRSMGYDVARPDILAVTGWTTGDLKRGMKMKETDFKESYDLVSLLIGVNNQYRGQDIERYKREFTFLLERSIELAGSRPGHVLVLSIPDYGVTPFAENRNPSRISAEIERYNQINGTISKEMGVIYVDITPVSKKAERDPSLLAGDRLHPSGNMYGQWVQRIVPVLVPELETWKTKQ